METDLWKTKGHTNRFEKGILKQNMLNFPLKVRSEDDSPLSSVCSAILVPGLAANQSSLAQRV